MYLCFSTMHKPEYSLEGLQIIPFTGLVCARTCTVIYGTLYRQVCAFQNPVQSTEFTTDEQDVPELNSEYHGKACEYLCACFS